MNSILPFTLAAAAFGAAFALAASWLSAPVSPSFGGRAELTAPETLEFLGDRRSSLGTLAWLNDSGGTATLPETVPNPKGRESRREVADSARGNLSDHDLVVDPSGVIHVEIDLWGRKKSSPDHIALD